MVKKDASSTKEKNGVLRSGAESKKKSLSGETDRDGLLWFLDVKVAD